MASIFANPLGSEANRPALDRLNSLKVRTMLTAITALLCGFIGAKLMVAPLARIFAWGYGRMLKQGNLPLVHVPLGASTELADWLPQATFLLVSALAIVGFSAGFFGRMSARVVMIPPLLAGLAFTYALPATSQWMHLVPSKLERDIMHGRFDAAESVLKQASLHPAVKQYVQAQIALRANDAQALRTYGEAVLKLADQLAYDLPATADHGAVSAAVQFNPEVIYALDLALNREPQTQVGIQWQQDYASRSPFWLWLGTIVMLGVGLALFAVSGGLFILWNGMRSRIRSIQGEIAPALNAQPTPIADAGDETAILTPTPESERTTEQEIARVETMSAHLAPNLASRASAPERITPVPKISQAAVNDEAATARRPGRKHYARNAALFIVAAGAVGWGLKSHFSKAAQQALALGGTHPCAYIGVWTAARDNSVYKVTLNDTGTYVAEPIARGRYSGATIRGA